MKCAAHDCLETFTPNPRYPWKRYHSRVCARRARRQVKAKGRKLPKRICGRRKCKRQFIPKRGNQYYCRPSCTAYVALRHYRTKQKLARERGRRIAA